MKKAILLSALLLLGGLLQAQTTRKVTGYARLPLVENKVVYTGLRPAGGVSQTELLARATQWAAQQIHSGTDTVRIRDEQAGRLVVHGLLVQPPLGVFKDPNAYAYTCTIQVKDGKYKYEFNQFKWTHSMMNALKEVAEGPFTHPLEYLGTLHQPNYIDNRTAYLDEQMQQLVELLDAAMTRDDQLKW